MLHLTFILYMCVAVYDGWNEGLAVDCKLIFVILNTGQFSSKFDFLLRYGTTITG